MPAVFTDKQKEQSRYERPAKILNLRGDERRIKEDAVTSNKNPILKMKIESVIIEKYNDFCALRAYIPSKRVKNDTATDSTNIANRTLLVMMRPFQITLNDIYICFSCYAPAFSNSSAFLRKTWTSSGSKCVPLPLLIVSTAARCDSFSLPGRSLVKAS